MPTHLPQIRLYPNDDLILKALARYHYLTTAQVTKLLYSPNSLETARKRLQRLRDAKIILERKLPTIERRSPSLFTLASRGRNYVTRHEGTVWPRFRPSETPTSYQYLSHTLELNDFLICLERAFGNDPAIATYDLIHEREMLYHPLATYLRDEAGRVEPQHLYPDAVLTLRYTSGKQRVLAVELDRGTEEQKKWKKKIANYVHYHLTTFQQEFPSTPFTIAVVTTHSQRRCGILRLWSEEVLEAMGKGQRYMPMLRFQYFAEMPGQTVVTEPRWERPFSPKLVCLIPIQQTAVALSNGSGQPPATSTG